MAEPKIAGREPVSVELVEGQMYFFCTCGQSANQPFCDGSHNGTEFTPKGFEAERSGTHFLCACKHSANMPYCDGTHNKLD